MQRASPATTSAGAISTPSSRRTHSNVAATDPHRRNERSISSGILLLLRVSEKRPTPVPRNRIRIRRAIASDSNTWNSGLARGSAAATAARTRSISPASICARSAVICRFFVSHPGKRRLPSAGRPARPSNRSRTRPASPSSQPLSIRPIASLTRLISTDSGSMSRPTLGIPSSAPSRHVVPLPTNGSSTRGAAAPVRSAQRFNSERASRGKNLAL